MITICTWLWGDNKYSLEDVRKLKRGLARHLEQPHRFLLMTERERAPFYIEGVERHAIKDPELTKIQGCFARLRMFDYGWQKNRGIDDRLVCMDLDTVLVGPLDILFNRPDSFVILRGGNSVNPCPFNGSIQMLRPGYHGELWTDFSIEAIKKIPFHQFPDDQGWYAHKIPRAGVWPCGRHSGIYAFKKPGWPVGSTELPKDARMVVFPGSRAPNQFTHLSWVRKHWV